MQNPLSGASRVYYIVGDPIAQVKSPAGVSQTFHERGCNAYVMPAHVAPAHLATWLAGVSLSQNVDGIIVTIPHKFAAFALCASTSPRARFLQAVNTLRRNADGSWHGDMFDGLGFVEALRAGGCEPLGKTALLVGAGGAGSAIAHALVDAGVRQLAVYDDDEARRTGLIQRLGALQKCPVLPGSGDAAGIDIAINATPAGMQLADPLPLRVDTLASPTVVGCVITAPAITPLISAARARGCATVTGAEMFARVRDLMVDFLLQSDAAQPTGALP